MDELRQRLEAATWVPKVVRTAALNSLGPAGVEARDLLAFALSTSHADAVGFWNALQRVHLPKDPNRRLTLPIQRHLITVVGARTVSTAKLLEAITGLIGSTSENAHHARDVVLALGQGVSLADAHGIYVSAARKAPATALPKTPPHLGGPTPELNVFETVELCIALATLAVGRRPSPECNALIAQAKRVLKLARAGKQGTAAAADRQVPATSKAKGPVFTLARAAVKEAWSTDHVSARGTSIKSGVVAGLELGDPAWWLTCVDEQVMLGDARTAWERKGETTSSPVVHLVWRGGDRTTQLWLARLGSGRYALLSKLGRKWASTEGDFDSVVATLPDGWFARAIPISTARR